MNVNLDAIRRPVSLAVALGAPLGVAAAMVPLRTHLANANVALILVAVVVAVAALGQRLVTVVAALSSMVWFDFFHTRPYDSFTIGRRDDLVTAVVLLLVGVAVGEIAIWGRRHRVAADEASDEIARIHRVAELVASGEGPDFVAMRVAAELRELLFLRDCRFEREDGSSPLKQRAKVERSGDVVLGEVRWGVHSMGLPGGEVELPLRWEDREIGRFILVPSPGVGVSFDRRVVAVALADQVSVAFAATGSAGR